MDRLKGKVAIVTGAGRGIGRAEALALAAEGASVVVNDLGVARDGTGTDGGPADEAVAEIVSLGGRAVANYDDVTSMAGGESMVRQAIETFGRLDILVNNAGIQINRPVFDITEDEWDRTIAIHIKGHWSTIRAAIPGFREQGSGCIINTSSMAGLGQMRHVDYVTAKEGIIGMTRALALELLPYGIRVNNIRPRATTRMITERRPEEIGDQPARPVSSAPANRDPQTLGKIVVFLASDAAKDITGHDVFAQGDEISIMSLPKKERSVILPPGWDGDVMEAVLPGAISDVIRKPVPY
jgi:3-oxoacyl-[acyl-carrier protein] reductase